MSAWLIAAIGLVYFIVAIDQFMKGGIGTGIMFIGYALGNVGLVMVAK
jgi:TM2 domain-containing membrane protein YozV